MKRCCLAIVEDTSKNQILMVENKRGMNKGFYNLPGGKIEDNETIEDGTVRESLEETGIKPINLKTKGKIEFQPVDMLVYVYHTNQFEGSLIDENNETKAFWVDKENIPYHKMRESDSVWLKEIFEGKSINKRITYNEDFSINKIENIYENIERYKSRYQKFTQLKNNKYLQRNKSL